MSNTWVLVYATCVVAATRVERYPIWFEAWPKTYRTMTG